MAKEKTESRARETVTLGSPSLEGIVNMYRPGGSSYMELSATEDLRSWGGRIYRVETRRRFVQGRLQVEIMVTDTGEMFVPESREEWEGWHGGDL